MPPARIEEKFLAVRRDGGTEVIGHRLVPIEFDRQAEGGREVDARLPLLTIQRRLRFETADVRHHLSSRFEASRAVIECAAVTDFPMRAAVEKLRTAIYCWQCNRRFEGSAHPRTSGA